MKSDFQLDDFLVDAASILYRIKCSLCSVGMPCQICVKLTQESRRVYPNIFSGYDLVLDILICASISYLYIHVLCLKL